MKKLYSHQRVQIAWLVSAFILLWHSAGAQANVVQNSTFASPSNNALCYKLVDNCIPYWYSSHGDPWATSWGSNLNPLYLENHAYDSPPYTSGAFQQIALGANQRCRLSFRLYSHGMTEYGAYVNSMKLTVALVSGLTPATTEASGVEPTPTSFASIAEVTYTRSDGGVWRRYAFEFTSPNYANPQLWLKIDRLTTGNYNGDMTVDSVSIKPICATANDIYYQNTAALPTDTRTEGKISAGSNVLPSAAQGPVTVQSTQTVAFYSLKEIALLPGFSAEYGADFKAIVVPCANINYKSGASAGSTSNQQAVAYPAPSTPCDCLRNTYLRTAAPTSNPTSLATIQSSPSSDVQLSPNPTDGKLMLRLAQAPTSGVGAFKVFNMMGQEVLTIDCRKLRWDSGGTVLDVTPLSTGLYYYKLAVGETVAQGKFEVRR